MQNTENQSLTHLNITKKKTTLTQKDKVNEDLRKKIITKKRLPDHLLEPKQEKNQGKNQKDNKILTEYPNGQWHRIELAD